MIIERKNRKVEIYCQRRFTDWKPKLCYGLQIFKKSDMASAFRELAASAKRDVRVDK